MATERKWFIRNIAEVKWREFPDHHGGALSKPLVMPETAGSRHIDYRISMYQPMAHVKLHRHKAQEQVYHVIEGEGLMEIDGEKHVVRRHDFIFLPPGVDHSIENTGLVDLVFLVVTSPVTDAPRPHPGEPVGAFAEIGVCRMRVADRHLCALGGQTHSTSQRHATSSRCVSPP